jgi:hypothetical protein
LLIGISGCRRRGGCCRREGELGWDLDSSGIVGTGRNDAVRSFSACRGRRRRSHSGRLGLGWDRNRNNGGCRLVRGGGGTCALGSAGNRGLRGARLGR